MIGRRGSSHLQPAHRLLITVFCLTVLMGTGAGFAMAWWNQNATMTMKVTAETLPSPVLTCSRGTNEQNVVVTWVPQRTGVTSYDVTVTRNGSTERTGNHSPAKISETITAPGGLNLAYTYTYSVIVKAHYGTWEAKPVTYGGIVATKSLLGSAKISCP